jgi:hypothetical protein
MISCKSGVGNMIKIETKKDFMLNAIHSFRGIAYDGCWFYFTVKDEKKIVKHDMHFNQIECFITCRCYAYLCYDLMEDCFFATDSEDKSCIYKLNGMFEEVDKLDISIPEIGEKKITGISNNHCSDRLYISFSNAIVSINKHCLNDCRILFCCNNKRIQGVTGIFSSYITYSISRPRQEIRISHSCGNLIKRIRVPACFRVESIVSMPCRKDNSKNHLYVLVTKSNGRQCVLEFIVVDCRLNEDNKCCCDALESIASEEVMIAHFLNVESERLIKIINSSNDIQEINSAKKSLCKIINKATNRELEIVEKLLKVMEHCDFCNEMDSCEDEV